LAKVKTNRTKINHIHKQASSRYSLLTKFTKLLKSKKGSKAGKNQPVMQAQKGIQKDVIVLGICKPELDDKVQLIQ